MAEGKVVVLAGPTCSGKSTAARFLSETAGFKSISTRDLLVEYAKKLDLKYSNLQEAGEQVNQYGGFIDYVCSRAGGKKKDTLIDSIKCSLDHEYLKRTFGDRYRLIYLQMPRQKRERLFDRRKRTDGNHDLNFETRENAKIEAEVPSLRDEADQVIVSTDPDFSLDSSIPL